MKRGKISKETRVAVHGKYGGRCAYCGKEISVRDMQVDHITAYGKSIYGSNPEEVSGMIVDGSIDDIGNLMPSCRACNFYKGINTIEEFRERILNTLSHTCISSFQTRLAMQYGMVEYHTWDGIFYFEKVSDLKDI